MTLSSEVILAVTVILVTLYVCGEMGILCQLDGMPDKSSVNLSCVSTGAYVEKKSISDAYKEHIKNFLE